MMILEAPRDIPLFPSMPSVLGDLNTFPEVIPNYSGGVLSSRRHTTPTAQHE